MKKILQKEKADLVSQRTFEPFISVVVPVEPGGSVKWVRTTLAEIDYPSEKMEIIVAEGRQPSRQRNEAVRNAKGEIIYFLDSDSRAVPDLFREVTGLYADSEIAVVGGPVLCPQDDSAIQHAFDAVLGSAFGSFSIRARYRQIGRVRETSEKEMILCNMSCRKKVFEETGGFNEKLYPNEENEFLNKVKMRGYKLIYSPGAFIFRSQRSTVAAYARQALNYGRGRMEQIFVLPRPTDAVHFVPTLFLFYLVSLLFFRPDWYLWPLWLYILLAVISSAVLAAGRKKFSYIFYLPFLFLLRHLAYGCGMIWGLMKKAAKEKPPESPVKIRNLPAEKTSEYEYYRQYFPLIGKNLDRIDVFRSIKDWCAGRKNILDWGCGIGYLTDYLGAKGLDINPSAIETAKKLFPKTAFHLYQGGKIPAGENFDAIVCYNVLEHLTEKERQDTFLQMKRVLSPDGVIIFGFVNLYHPLERLAAFCKRNTAINDPTHVYNWTIPEFVEVIKRDFEIVESKKVSQFSLLICIARYFKAALILKCRPR